MRNRISVFVFGVFCAVSVLFAERVPLKVLTWNTMHYGWDQQTEELKQYRDRALVEIMLASGADVLLVQETYGCYERFLELLPKGWHGALLGSCNSVYSRYPIVRTSDVYRTEDRFYGTATGWNYAKGDVSPFTIGVAEIDVRGQRVRVCPIAMNWQPYCVKFPLDMSPEDALAWEAAAQPNGGRPRPQAMASILASIRDMVDGADDVPIVIGGDFNSQSHLDWTEVTKDFPTHVGRVIPWQVSTKMVEAGFVDTFRKVHPDPSKNYGVSVKDFDHPVRLDYIYAKGRKLTVVDSELVFEPYLKPVTYRGRTWDRYPSDHGFFMTTFDLQVGK